MQPLVSILIPAYNAREYIADTLKSALAQTWARKEVIVVDDGSRDGTLEVAQQFASKDVQVIGQPNQGASAARNHAFSLCQGEYIQWLDADDLLSPDKVEKQIAVLESGGGARTLLCCPYGLFIYRPHRAEFTPNSLWCDLSPIDWMLRYFERRDYMQTSTWLVSRELTQAAGPWDTRLTLDDDGEYFSRVVLASSGVRFVPEARVYYRRSANSLSYMGRSHRKLESQFLSMQLQFEHLRAIEDTPRVRKACLSYLQSFLVHYYPERPDIVAQAQRAASKLGGHLQVPELPWKYAWIQKVFGWSAAKRVQLSYNLAKSSLLRAWDRTWYRLEQRGECHVKGTM